MPHVIDLTDDDPVEVKLAPIQSNVIDLSGNEPVRVAFDAKTRKMMYAEGRRVVAQDRHARHNRRHAERMMQSRRRRGYGYGYRRKMNLQRELVGGHASLFNDSIDPKFAIASMLAKPEVAPPSVFKRKTPINAPKLALARPKESTDAFSVPTKKTKAAQATMAFITATKKIQPAKAAKPVRQKRSKQEVLNAHIAATFGRYGETKYSSAFETKKRAALARTENRVHRIAELRGRLQDNSKAFNYFKRLKK